MPRPQINRKTHVIDAEGQVLGRLATRIVLLLQGKHKPSYLPNIDDGDFVRVNNAGKFKLTGNKAEQKVYHHFSGYPGGMKTRKISDHVVKDPGRIIRMAVERMLPKNRLQSRRLKRLLIEK